jgi:hypothetical protein
MDSFISTYVRALARNKQPPPYPGYEGSALEFVESLDLRKLSLQLIAALTVSIVAGTTVGVQSESLERGFLIAGLGISLSQLLVATLILVISPPPPPN